MEKTKKIPEHPEASSGRDDKGNPLEKTLQVGRNQMRMVPEAGKNQELIALRELLEENLALTKEVHKFSKRMNNYVLWERTMGFLKILIFVIPVILGYLYFPQIKGLFNEYKAVFEYSISILKNMKNSGLDPSSINLDNIPADLLEKFKK